MALEIVKKIGNITEAKTGLSYELKSDESTVFDSGTVDTDATGNIKLSMVGKIVSLGDEFAMLTHNFNGVNFSTFGHSMCEVIVTDDGVIADEPESIKLMFIGDSIIDNGSGHLGAAGRPSTKNIQVKFKSPGTAAALLLCESTYFYVDDQGIGNTQTSHLVDSLPQVLAADWDVCAMMIGTNDVDAEVDIETIKSNATVIINAISGAGKLLIIPILHRYDGGSDTARWNAKIDDINAWYAIQADDNANVEIAPVASAWNSAISDENHTPNISNDRLHPTNAGGMLAAKELALALDSLYPSSLPVVNLLPEFIGTGGFTSSGSTGSLPDGFQGRYALPTSGVGFDVTDDNGIGINVRTSGAVDPGSSAVAQLGTLLKIPVNSGLYMADITVIFDNPDLIETMKLTINAGTATYGNCELLLNDGAIGFTQGVEYKIRTPTCYAADESDVSLLWYTRQDAGDDLSYRIKSFRLYRVGDLPA